MTTIDNVEELRSIYRPAMGAAVKKVISELDAHCIDFLAKSPFMVLSTTNADGEVDGSPKGGAPGFARVHDGRVGWADSSGNNRLDSFENIVSSPSVALLFMIPGLDETLRINGVAELSTHPDHCAAFSIRDKPAKVVALVTVHEAYVHCAKAYRRAGLWDPTTWPDSGELPNGAVMFKDHAALGEPVDEISQWYADDIDNTLWKPGGE